MTLADELKSRPRRIRSRRRMVMPLGPWDMSFDPQIRREEIQRIHWARSNRRRNG